MPKQYEAIRDSFIKKGESEKEAKTRAAKIFIANGNTGDRHSRAVSLHTDSPKKLKFPSPSRKKK